MIKKTCRKCGFPKKAKDFPKGRDSNGLYYICKRCTILRSQKRYRDKSPIARWADATFSDIKGRSKRKEIPFTLVKSDMYEIFSAQQGKCKYCTREFDLNGTQSNHMKSPSVDRIKPILGYIKPNVVLACVRCNVIKNDASLEELQKITSVLESLLATTDQNCLS